MKPREPREPCENRKASRQAYWNTAPSDLLYYLLVNLLLSDIDLNQSQNSALSYGPDAGISFK
jgi:hypothetical protein